MARGRSKAALKKAKKWKKSGYSYGSTSSSLFGRLKRKLRNLRKKHKKKHEPLISRDDDILAAVDERSNE